MAKWASPERQAHLVELFIKSNGFCVFTNKPCQGTWERKSITVCIWGKFCSSPVPDGTSCRYKPEEGKPILPCHTLTVHANRFHCTHGDYPCSKPYSCHYELYTNSLVKEWIADDRAQSQAEWQAERLQLHSLGERRTPLRGMFSNIGKDIFYPRQPEYYLEGLGISGLTFTPFAKVRIANSFMRLFIDLGNALKPMSKNKRRKAIRYGKPLPKEISSQVSELCNKAVRHYRKE
jgi:hypothetical protein